MGFIDLIFVYDAKSLSVIPVKSPSAIAAPTKGPKAPYSSYFKPILSKPDDLIHYRNRKIKKALG